MLFRSVIEILSDTTAKVDRTTKKDLYAELGIEEYFWFDPVTLEFVGHRLVNGDYERLEPDDRGYCWSQTLELWLGRWNRQLRYFSADGQLILTPEEDCDRALEKADRADLKANQLAQERDRLAQKLRDLGINPDSL